MLSLIIPVYNEKEAIEETILSAHNVLQSTGMDFEILAVNDGSTDGTADILAQMNVPNLTVITHPINRGYGTCMKTAIRKANGEMLAMTDADGTYPIVDFPKLISVMQEEDCDMVVGARTKKGVQIPLIRRPAKWMINRLVNFVTGMHIPDNNSGMRIVKKEIAKEFMHLYPQGFSFTITITLATITSGYMVKFVPIDYFKRKGKSSMSAGLNGIKHFLFFIGLITRITTYFTPLKVFAWPAIVLMAAGLGYIGHTLAVEQNISDGGMLVFLSGMQIGLFGLLAEVVARQARAKK